MQFKPVMIEKIRAGTKTQTRRPTQIGERLALLPDGRKAIYHEHGAIKWAQRSDYAVCPGRGKKAVLRIVIDDLWQEDLTGISDEAVRAEGFADRAEFFAYWDSLWGHHRQGEVWVLSFRLLFSFYAVNPHDPSIPSLPGRLVTIDLAEPGGDATYLSTVEMNDDQTVRVVSTVRLPSIEVLHAD